MLTEIPTTFCYGFIVGLVVGGAVTQLQRHPTRRRAWIPAGFGLLLCANLFAAFDGDGWFSGILVGCGLIAGAAGTTRGYLGGPILLFAAIVAHFFTGATSQPPPMVIAIFCGVMFALFLCLYRRPVGETLGEWVIRIMYRMRMVGPGVEQMPRTGPVLVISNHTAYLDPCWVMICLPRDLTPIMFGEYFKKFGLHFYMKQIINAIPSGGGTIRREVPELDEVVRRMDRGEGVLVFPEGWVRRKEEEPIRRFAQGPWRILRDRPATPVVACWIEGGWGSWSSFWNGPPFKGKRIDFRRPINIGVSAPVVLDKEVLSDQMRTRELLKEMVLDARRHLNLPPIGKGEPGA